MDRENKALNSDVPPIEGGQVHIHGDVVGRDKIVYEAPPLVIPALHQLPPPPRDFIGRKDELAELMAAVETGGVTISGFQGVGGVGKTAVALKLAERLSTQYPDAQFYLDLKGVSAKPLAVKDAMAFIVRAYYPDARIPEEEAQLSGLYRSVLYNQRALLLMDNARDALQIEPLIPPDSCFLLVTSRQHFALPGFKSKNLNSMLPADAKMLLLRLAPRLGENQGSLDGLALFCGCLPLALRSVGSALGTRSELQPSDYLRKLTDVRERLKLTAVDASLRMSYDLLEPILQQRFRFLAVFPDTFDRKAAAVVWDLTTQEVTQEALGGLMLYSLVEFNPSTERYQLHDLVRLFADACLQGDPPTMWQKLLRLLGVDTSERAVAQVRYAMHYKNVVVTAAALNVHGTSELEGLTLLNTEWKNIQAGQAWAAEKSGEDKAAARLVSDYPEASRYLFTLRQPYKERIRWLELALAAARRLKDRNAEANHLCSLGMAHFPLGEHRSSIEYYQQYLQLARELRDLTRESEALANLGDAYSHLEEYRRAVEVFQQLLTIARTYGSRKVEAVALGRLGTVYQNSGDYRKAIEYHELNLALARELGDQGDEASTLGDLGRTYDSLGEYEAAIECHQKQLAIAREIGKRRPQGSALSGLGYVFAHSGEYRRAIEFFEQSLAITREIADQRSESYALGNLGNAYSSLGEYRRAIEYYELRLNIAREIGHRLGEQIALRDLGNAYFSLKDYQRSKEYFEEHLRVLGDMGYRPEFKTLWDLGAAYAGLDDYQRAKEYFEQSLAIARDSGDRGDEAFALMGLGSVCSSSQEYGRSFEYCEKALVIRREIGDEEGEADALFGMSLNCDKMGKRSEAIGYMKSALAIYEKSNSPSATEARGQLDALVGGGSG
jgi:tetratricopeptide (TPR) repeat protein